MIDIGVSIPDSWVFLGVSSTSINFLSLTFSWPVYIPA